jgi:uncharacterized membrane protein
MRAFVAYLTAGAVMFVLDAIWLSTMSQFYRQHIGTMLMDGFRPVPAAVFYFLYVAGIVLLAVWPALRYGEDWRAAAMSGAILGLVAYGTYDLTNYATLKTWSATLTAVDMAWGTVLTATAATAAFAVAKRFV